MSETVHNYDLDFCGHHSIVSTDDRGKIINTALPFKKYEGMDIDEFHKKLQDEKYSYKGMKDLGKSGDRVLIMKGQEPEAR